MLGVSAFWGLSRGLTVSEMAREAVSLGFGALELDGVRGERWAELLPFIEQGLVEVPSLHDPCSLGTLYGVVEPPQGDWLASKDVERRRAAVECGKRAIAFAATAGCSVMVVHAGKVKIPSYQHELGQLLQSVGRDDPEYQALFRRAIEEREEAHWPHVENVLNSLEQLGHTARDMGIRLGIETRVGYIEMPNMAEMRLILDQLSDLPVHYWHDAGHAQVMENLGFQSHKEYLSTFASRLIGVHLHDAVYAYDHMAPGEGKIDFEMLARYIPPDAIKVIEPFQAVTYERMQLAVEFLQQHGLD